VFLEKLVVSQPVKTFHAFYGSQRFIIVLARARHFFLSKARSIPSTTVFHFLKIHLNVILPSTPRSSKFPSFLRFPALLYPFYIPYVPHAQPILSETDEILFELAEWLSPAYHRPVCTLNEHFVYILCVSALAGDGYKEQPRHVGVR
jgi:hypothetical protein